MKKNLMSQGENENYFMACSINSHGTDEDAPVQFGQGLIALPDSPIASVP
ncbi:MAG: hypothetical protein ACOY90_18865 [Candidatus Zhuqueibacterota bacterium]